MLFFVSGSSGNVGNSICQCLSSKWDIVRLDRNNVDTNTMSVSRFIAVDLCEYKDVFEAARTCPPDSVIHCAGIAHQKIGSIDSNEYFRVNSLATENLAKAAIGANPDVHFVFLSSISVYGEGNNGGIVSEEAPCAPSSDYAESKLDAEKRLRRLYASGQLKKLDILRLAPVYDFEWSLNLDRRVFAPKKIAYFRFGKGNQKLSAVSRQNLIDFIEFLVDQSEMFGERYCNVYNVCDEQPYTFNTIIETFKRSPYHPDRFVLTVPLPLVWLATRVAGLVFKTKQKWLHSCFDKLAGDLVFDNERMLSTGFNPEQTLETVFLTGKK